MRYLTLLATTAFFFLFIACDEENKCACRELEDCIDGECVLQENCFYINNQGIKGVNLYHGVVKSNVCVDTLAFDAYFDESEQYPHFTLFANLHPWGVVHIESNIGLKISDDEYVSGSGVTICRQNGKEWYPSYVHTKIAPDSVLMTIKFREWFDTSDEYVDSCQVTLYK
jgi:hypothetical protein